MNTIFHYPNCSTCVKARKWLAAEGIEAEVVDLVKTPPSADALRSLWERSGLPLKKFFNTAGQSYRKGGWKDRLPATSEDDQLAALAADGKLIKRPVLDLGDAVLVGFRPDAWREAVDSL
jgi:arsenate reductase (glutaredoxin)